ncbi:YfhO family protein [Arcticibacterium luteifluviistationis]|uniref:YfhO family protein n=1 Tax=Arcticibacterium luteifluviistationis TaxID=1784714 RepID=A0A2Z4GF52_9BACT|nr:YfhO family protein [Arcticibacterium luteifluviistationis]AWV99684.1 hypothetical protein DJ013_16495 [Arcticibacterium luteifluviistationis]
MKNKFDFRSSLPYALAILFFLIITMSYFSPLLSGKTLSMHDTNMAGGAAKELNDYHEQTGEWAWWTNSMFGGMPGYMIAGAYPNSLSSKIGSFFYQLLPLPASPIFLMMIGFFIFMISLKRNIWVSVIASVAYAFGTYNMLYLEAGHVSKILALAYGPALMAGFTYIFRGKYILGTFLTALFLGLELYANHLQITYYFMLILIAYSTYEAVKVFKEKRINALPKIALSFAIALFVGVGMNSMRLWNNITYSAETTRGKTELKSSTAGNDGLDRSYAFSWSYGIDETFNLIVPDLMGGGSAGALSENSEVFKTLNSGGVDMGAAKQFIKQLPLYHGDQSVTSGPSYSGIIIFFLFLLGLFISKGKLKWLIASLTSLFIVLSWGSHFPAFNNLFFDIFPGYNKFRAVTMILTLVHFLLVWGAANTLSDLLKIEFTWDGIKKLVYTTYGIIFGLMFLGYFMVDFNSPRDQNFIAGLSQSLGNDFAQRLLNALRTDRSSMALNDIYRGLVLLALVIGAIFLLKKNKISNLIFGIVAIVLVMFDFISVDKRYFNNSDFEIKRFNQATFQPSAADQQILADKDPNFRVINLTTGFWSDARDSYFHKSIGGYHGAKLKKIQELYEYQMIKDGRLNMPILNMLNTKYFINNGPENTPIAQQNPDALGNAWFVNTLKVVPNADEELATLGEGFNPDLEAVTQENYMLETKTYKKGSNSSITLTSYAPNKLLYSSNSNNEEFAVFSEIFYRGNKDWFSYIDGKPVEHLKVNYVLRGLEIPAGKHEITFEFKPKSVESGKMIDLVASVGLVLLFGACLFITFKKE